MPGHRGDRKRGRDGADPGGPGWPVSDPWPRKDEDDCGRDPHEAAALQNHVRHLHLHKYYRDEKPPTYDPHSAQHKQPYYSISRELGSFASSSERHYFDPYALAYHGDRSPSQLVAPPPFAAGQHGQLSHPSTLLLQHCRMEASDAPAAPGNDGPKIDRRSLDGNPTAGRNSAGGSPMGSPMPTGGASKTRMDRLCGVCGDRALGYNFNAITCESCKAFFRRNALKNKNLKCPFQDNCSVDTVTRRFCQKCRLRKCFEIGMKKEWIMTEEEKLKKKQKIEANKLRKQAGDGSLHPSYGCVEAPGRSSPSHSPSFKTELSPSPASSTASMEHGDQAPEFHFSRRPSAEFEIPGSPEGLKKPYVQSHMIVHEKTPLGSPYFSIPSSTVLQSNDTHSKPHAVVIGMVRGTEANGAGPNTDNTASKVMRLDNQSDVHHEGVDTGAGAQPPAPLSRHESATSLSHMGGTPGVELTPHPFQGARSSSVYESAATPAVPVASVTPVPHVTESPTTTASLREAFSQAARTHPQVFSNASSSPPTVMSVPHSPPAPHGSYVCMGSVPSMLSAALNMHAGAPRQLPRDFSSSFDPFSGPVSPTSASQFGPHYPLTTSAPHATHRNPSSKASDYRDTGPLASNGHSISRNVPSNSLDASSCAAAGAAAASGPGCLGRSQLLRASAKPITRNPEIPSQDFPKIGIVSSPASSSASLCVAAASGSARVKQEPSWSPGASELKSCDSSSSSSPLRSSISSGRNSSAANLSILKFETGCKQNENSLLKSRLSSPGLLSLPVSPISRTPPNFCTPSFVFPSEENFTCNPVSNSASSESLARRMGASVSTSQESSPHSGDLGSASGHLPSPRQNLPATSEESLLSKDSPSASEALPSVSGELPSASLVRPPTSEDFQVASEKLSFSTDIPSACEESTPVTASSRCTSKESISPSTELPSAFEKLSTPKELSIALEEIPSTSEELLSTPGEFQTTLKKLPLTSGELPSASGELLSASEELPSISEELPSISEAQPSISEAQPSISEEQPSISEEQPSISEEQPSISKEHPSISEKQSSIHEGLSSATSELSSLENLHSNSEDLLATSEELRPSPVSLLATNEGLPFTPENLPVEELSFTLKEPQTTSNDPLKSCDEVSISDVKPSASNVVTSASDVIAYLSDVVTSAPGVTSASDVVASASSVIASASGVIPSSDNTPSASDDVKPVSSNVLSACDGVMPVRDSVPSANGMPSSSYDAPLATAATQSASHQTQTEPSASSSTFNTTPSLEDAMSFSVLEALKKIQDNDASQNGGILPKGASESSYRDSIVNSAVEAEMSPYTLLLGAGQGRGLTAAERHKLDELERADYAMLAPLSDDQDYRKDQVNPSLINVINMTDIAIRRLIQMAKQLSSFSSLCVHDQIALLKGSCTEMMILRSVTAYDADKEAWKIPEHRDTYKSIKLKVLKGAPGNVHVYEEHKRFILAFRPEWRHDQNIMLLLSAITLFTPTRPNVQHRMAIQHEQCCYLLLLKRYLESRLGVCESRAVYWDLLERINDLRRLNENHVQVYMQVNPEEVRPLLIEIFDLKQR